MTPNKGFKLEGQIAFRKDEFELEDLRGQAGFATQVETSEKKKYVFSSEYMQNTWGSTDAEKKPKKSDTVSNVQSKQPTNDKEKLIQSHSFVEMLQFH